MYNKGFYFEIHDLLTQFIAAMDDVVIGRYNKNREQEEQIKVRYVNAPKERVLYDIVNKAQNLTVPVISVNINSLSRDETRVFNKIHGFHAPAKSNVQNSLTAKVRMPVPVNVVVNLNIITNYQSDMDQILSNFIPYSNPYIVISWKIPDDFGLASISEIRSEVLWDGNVTLEYPTDMEATVKPRFVANTSYTIKGWLFPEAPNEFEKNIYFINSNFRTSSKLVMDFDSLSSLETENYTYDKSKGLLNENETVSISAVPYITNLYLTTSNPPLELSGHQAIVQSVDKPTTFMILGKNLKYTNSILVSSDISSFYQNYSAYSFVYYPSMSGYEIPASNISILSDNVIYFTLPTINLNSNINIVLKNDIGWMDTNSINTRLYYLSGF